MSTTEHVFLAAFQTQGITDREAAEAYLTDLLPQPSEHLHLECWWVAEDDRHDRSDCDSAVFVNPGRQDVAYRLLEQAGLANQGGLGFPEPGEEWEPPQHATEAGLDTAALWERLHAVDEALPAFKAGQADPLVEALTEALGQALSLLSDLGVKG